MISGQMAGWSESLDSYSDKQIYSVLVELGVDVVSETDSVWLCLCPFHRNTSTPSFAVNKTNGLYLCFNGGCEEKGSLLSLVMKVGSMKIFPAKRLISKFENNEISFEKEINDIFDAKNVLPSFPQDLINEMADRLWTSPAYEYMRGRGFDDKTLAYFQIGYSEKKKLVAIPVHDWDAMPVGVIGRTLIGKRFENSKNIPTKKTLFNIHRAKKVSDKVVVVESAMDAMRIHQAGFPNVVSTNGGWFTESHQQILNKYFNEIIIMTDNDSPEDHRMTNCKKCSNTCIGHSPGRVLGEKISNAMNNKRVKWASAGYGVLLPNGAKDPGDLTESQISDCIANAVSSIEYEFWKNDVPGFDIS